jgi:hypothetical protein
MRAAELMPRAIWNSSMAPMILLSIALVFITASCAVKDENPFSWVIAPKVREEIESEVRKAEHDVQLSLPELKYALASYRSLATSMSTVEIPGAEGKIFQLLILDCPSMSFPGDDFMLVYLKNQDGAIVDWKSQWLYTRLGNLESKFLDVNADGVKDFCFVSIGFQERERILAAFCVRDGKFDPVIAEHTAYFDIEFEDRESDGGLVLQPQLKGKQSFQTEKIYEIPIKVVNRSNEVKNLNGCSVWFSEDFYGSSTGGGFNAESLPAGAAAESTVTVRFTAAPRDRKLGFMMINRN